MPSLCFTTYVNADFDVVKKFFSTVDGLIHLTPSVLPIKITEESVPNTEIPNETLPVGSRIRLQGPFSKVGITQGVVFEISKTKWGSTEGMFQDRQLSGPFTAWRHSHYFIARQTGTLIIDIITYELPTTLNNQFSKKCINCVLSGLFIYRKYKTRQLLSKSNTLRKRGS